VVEGGGTTIRFNTPDGRHEAREYDERNWRVAENADLAVYLMPEANPSELYFHPISVEQFITRDIIARVDMGIGDEVFFAGRFVNAEGKERNRPSLRFGTIAQVGTNVVDGEESFLIEARSIPGYSGSPVFFYIKSGVPRTILSPLTVGARAIGPYLIGIDWSHINDYVDARDERGRTLAFKIRSNSGMMGVVPVWKLEELLFRADVKDQRLSDPRNIRASSPDAIGGGPAAQQPAAGDQNPDHREDFMRLVSEAAKKPPQDPKT
jgi:hypothetical protein